MRKIPLMILLIDRYSDFIYEIADTAQSLVDDLALNSKALKEFQTSYTSAEIEEYNQQLKLKKFFEEVEEAERQTAIDGGLDSSILGDNFWNE